MAKGIYKFWDGNIYRTFAARQRKHDSTIKVLYKWNFNKWELIFEGTFDGLQKEMKHQKKLAQQAEIRSSISDICGTSYAAAKRDMGL